MLVASHDNEIEFTLEKTLEEYKFLICRLPNKLIEHKEEDLESGARLQISICPFFDGYMGVGYSVFQANLELCSALSRLFSRLIKEGTLLDYLEDKNFSTSLWSKIADLSQLQTSIAFKF